MTRVMPVRPTDLEVEVHELRTENQALRRHLHEYAASLRRCTTPIYLDALHDLKASMTTTAKHYPPRP